MVIERQRLLVLHAANTTQLDRANGKHTARAQRVRIAGTLSSLDRNAEADNYQKAKSGVDFVHGAEPALRSWNKCGGLVSVRGP